MWAAIAPYVWSFVASAVGSLVVNSLAGGGGGQAPAQPSVTPPPQPSRMPDQAQTIQRKMASMGQGPAAATSLTGPGGVPNSLLNLGQTMLGR